MILWSESNRTDGAHWLWLSYDVRAMENWYHFSDRDFNETSILEAEINEYGISNCCSGRVVWLIYKCFTEFSKWIHVELKNNCFQPIFFFRVRSVYIEWSFNFFWEFSKPLAGISFFSLNQIDILKIYCYRKLACYE